MQPKDTTPRNMARDQRRRLARRNAHQGKRPMTPFLLFALAVGMGLPAHAATDAYIGPNNGDYGTATNWNPNVVPGVGNTDDAVNNTLNAINFNTTATINSFSGTDGAAFNVQSGTLSGAKANAASLFASNGAITAINSTLSNLTVSGTLTVNNNVTLANVVLEGSPSLTQAGLTDYTVGQVTLGAGGGTATATVGGTLDLGSDNNNATLTVAAGSALSGAGLITNYNGGNFDTLANDGTIDANVSGSTLQLNQSAFINAGTAEATNGGTLLLTNNVTDSGTLLASGAGSAVTLSGATLTGTGTGLLLSAQGGGTLSAVNEGLVGSFVTSGAGLTVNNNVTLSGFTLGSGKVSLTQAGLTDYTVGQVTLGAGGGAATATVGGTLDLGSDNNNATLTVAAGSALSGAGLITNYNGGNFDTLANDGTIDANVSGSTLQLNQSAFINAGTAEATNGGTLLLTNNVTDSGTLLASGAGSAVTLSGATLTGTGTGLLLSAQGGGTLSAVNEGLVGSFVTSGAGLTVNNNVTLNGFTLTSGKVSLAQAGLTDYTVGSVTLGGGTAMTAATATLGGGTLDLGSDNNNATLTVAAGSALSGAGLITNYNGGNTDTLVNDGTIDAAGGTLTVATTGFTNNNTVEATAGGTLDLSGATFTDPSGGLLAATGGGTVNLAGSTTFAAGSLFQTDMTGTINLASGGTVTGTATGKTPGSTLTAGNNVTLSGFTLENGNITLAPANLTDYTVGQVTLGGGTAQTAATATLGGGALDLGSDNNNATLTVSAGSALSGSGTVQNYNAGNTDTLVNDGTIDAAGGTLTVATTGFTNNNTVEATAGGTLDLSGATFTDPSGGLLAATGGGTVNLAGSTTFAAGSLFQTDMTGTINLASGGTVTGTATGKTPGSTLTAGNNVTLSGFTLDSGVITLAPANLTDYTVGQVTLGGGTAQTAATATLGGGALDLGSDNNNATLTVSAGSALSGSGTVQNYNAGNTGTLANNGTIEAKGGTLNLTASILDNAGLLQADNSATLAVTSATTDTGAVTVQQGGTATFSQPTVTQTGNQKTQVDGNLTVGGGTGTFVLGSAPTVAPSAAPAAPPAGGNPPPALGLLLDGTGTVNANVDNLSGTVKGGDSPGTLTINGNYSQASGAKMFDGIGGFGAGQSDLLDVTGDVTITPGAILNVDLVNGFMPLSTDPNLKTPIVFLDYGALDPAFLTSNFTVDSVNPGYSYAVIDQANATGTGGDLALTITHAPPPMMPPPPMNPAVPEPSSLALFGLGGLALIGVARRRRSA